MSIFRPETSALSAETAQHSWWTYALLGAVLFIAGAIVLGDVVAASVISAIFISWAIVVAGFFQIMHAFSLRHWDGFLFDLLVGLLYIIFGVILLGDPGAAAMKLTILLGGLLVASGVLRAAFAVWKAGSEGAGLLVSGIIAVLAGILILAKWPQSGLWVLGLFLGADLAVHGIAWIVFAMSVRSKRSTVNPLMG